MLLDVFPWHEGYKHRSCLGVDPRSGRRGFLCSRLRWYWISPSENGKGRTNNVVVRGCDSPSWGKQSRPAPYRIRKSVTYPLIINIIKKGWLLSLISQRMEWFLLNKFFFLKANSFFHFSKRMLFGKLFLFHTHCLFSYLCISLFIKNGYSHMFFLFYSQAGELGKVH